MPKTKPVEIPVERELIDGVFRSKRIAWYELGETEPFYPNQYVILYCSDTRLPCRADNKGDNLHVITRKDCVAAGIKARVGNEEQLLALDACLDPSIPLVTLSGRAGSGKTLIALAAAIHQFGKYDRILLLKPQSQVGQFELGILPGTIEERTAPYLGNFMSNLEVIVGDADRAMEQYNIEFQPLQLIRGCSWRNTFVIADEVQVLNKRDMLTLGTRLGDGSKMVLLADYKQRDTHINIEDTGLHNLENSQLFAKSNLTASVELVKVERSPIVALFADILE